MGARRRPDAVRGRGDGNEIFLKPEDILDLYAKRQVVIGGARSENGHDKTPSCSLPTTSLSPSRRRALVHSTRFDKAPCRLSDKALSRFIAANKDEAIARASPIVPVRAPCGLGDRRAWRAGTPAHGRDPHEDGEGSPHESFARAGSVLFERLVAWYWSEEGRQKKEAHARLDKMIEIVNRSASHDYGEAWEVLPTRPTRR